MSKEKIKPTFLNPEKASFYKDDIKAMHKRVRKHNDVILPKLTSADFVIPMSTGSEIIGFGFMFMKEDGCYLMEMVEPEFQGKGLGAKLLDEMEAVAKKKGVKVLISQVINTPKARQLQIDAGFIISEQSGGRVTFIKNIE